MCNEKCGYYDDCLFEDYYKRPDCSYKKYDCYDKSCDCVFTDIICGRIFFQDNFYAAIWKPIGISAAITIRIINSSDSIMWLAIKGKKYYLIKILPHSERSVTAENVRNIVILCNCLDRKFGCLGNYELIIHYISNLEKDKKRRLP